MPNAKALLESGEASWAAPGRTATLTTTDRVSLYGRYADVHLVMIERLKRCPIRIAKRTKGPTHSRDCFVGRRRRSRSRGGLSGSRVQGWLMSVSSWAPSPTMPSCTAVARPAVSSGSARSCSPRSISARAHPWRAASGGVPEARTRARCAGGRRVGAAQSSLGSSPGARCVAEHRILCRSAQTWIAIEESACFGRADVETSSR